MTGTAQVIHGNARHLPLADDSVDLVVTSPPYFALRSYQDGGVHYDGQIGSEPTPAEFVDALIEVTRECMRVLKPSGSLWVNLGDKYAQAEERSRNGNGNRVAIDGFTGGSGSCPNHWPCCPCPHPRHGRGATVTLGRKDNGVPRKSLIGIPWRYALRCIDDLGLILRAEVIWSKPNGLPESVTDRVRRSHEQWFHFTLNPRYYSAVDEIREAHVETQRRGVLTWDERRGRDDQAARYSDQNGHGGTAGMAQSALGKLPGSVWTIPTEPLTVPDHLGVDHFAAFPTEWPKRIIAGWSPAGVCCACGEGRRPVVDKERTNGHVVVTGAMFQPGQRTETADGKRHQFQTGATLTGYACACTPSHLEERGYIMATVYDWHLWDSPPPTTPGVVLDPFGGTGTTAMVAKALGRHGITVDMSADYCRLARWRTEDRNQLAKVLGIEKVPAPDPGQLDLFGEAVS